MSFALRSKLVSAAALLAVSGLLPLSAALAREDTNLYFPPEEFESLKSNSPKREPFQLNAQKIDLGAQDETHVAPSRLSRQNLAPPLAPSFAPMRAGVQGNAPLNGLVDKNQLGAFASDTGLMPMRATSDTSRRPPLKGAAAVQLLADYDIELIVDESMSMRRNDCPGGLSRWNWCGRQASALAHQLTPFVPLGFTMTTFAGNYEVYKNSQPRYVEQLFSSPNFGFGTRLSLPLEDRLGNYFRNRRPGSKPLLIAVITDGVPAPFREDFKVADTLIEATKRIGDPREINVVFFQIGGANRRGRAFLWAMDNQLVRLGARHDVVNTVSFEQLQQVGLANALADSIRHFGSNRSKAQISN